MAPIKKQFGLRAMLVTMTICAMVAGYFGHQKYKAHLAKKAVEAIAEIGGKFKKGTKENKLNEEVVRVLFRGEAFTDDTLEKVVPHLRNLPHLVELDFVKTKITDKGIKYLQRVRHIEKLYLFETTLTEKGIEQLEERLPDNILVTTEEPEPISSGMASINVYSHAIVGLDWTPDGKHLATGSGDGKIRMWDFRSPNPVTEWKAHEDWAFALAYSPDGKMIATGGGDNMIRLWDAESQELLGQLEGHQDDVHAIVFSLDGTTLVSSGDDATIRYWDVASQTETRMLTGHAAQIPSIAISPDGKLLASASRDDTVRLWSFESGSLIETYQTGGQFDVNTVAFNPTSTQLASGDQSGKVQIWDIETSKLVRSLTGHNGKIYKIAFDSDGKGFASCGDDGVIMWDLESDHKNRLGQQYVSNLAYHPSSPFLATTSAAGEIHLLHKFTGQTLEIARTMFGERGFDFVD